MLKGWLTYLSGGGLALSWLAERFGIPATPDEIESALNAVLAAVSTVGVIYGRWRATRKVNG